MPYYWFIMIEGFILGISNTFGCLSACAPVLIPYFLTSERKPVFSIIEFLAGRLVAYFFFALFAGYTSVYFEGKIHPDILFSATIILAIWLIVYSIRSMKFHIPICHLLNKRLPGINFPLIAGFVLGLNICPPFLMGLNEILKFADITKSLIFFGGFYIGSSIWVFIFFFAKTIQNKNAFRIAGQILGIGVGIYFLVKGIRGFF